MKQVIIEEISQTIANRFFELYAQAEILGEKSVYMEVRNNAEACNQNDSVFSWGSFTSYWTAPESAVNRLNQLWQKTLGENLMFFYQENRREISLALVEALSELYEGEIKVTSTPLVLVVQVER